MPRPVTATRCPDCGSPIKWLQSYKTLEIYQGCANWTGCRFRLRKVKKGGETDPQLALKLGRL